MYTMKLKMTLILTLLALFTACSNPAEKYAGSNSLAAVDTSAVDSSVRAIAVHQDGKIIIKPESHASSEVLGAPSCYGLETDLKWTGDYEVLWDPASGKSPSKIMSFPDEFEIIQPSDKAVQMQKITIDNTDLFAYFPSYTDCHALETYFFGVKDGEAFPITIAVNPEEQPLTHIGKHPNYPLQVTNGELQIIGGEGGGREFVDVYHFSYDSEKHSLILHKTDQVDGNDLRNEQLESTK